MTTLQALLFGGFMISLAPLLVVLACLALPLDKEIRRDG